MIRWLAPQWIGLGVLAAAAAAIHWRGKVRFRLARQLTDFSTFAAPLNLFTYVFSAVPNRPMLDAATFPELEVLRVNWRTIRDEGRALYAAGHVHGSDRNDDIIGNSLFKHGWKRFYIKWYGEILPSARELCPRTVALVRQVPNLHAAMFSAVAPHSRLGRHRDPFAASLRYHLGLATPNSEACRIYVDGEPYAWKDGEGVLFDETYVHWVENDTDEVRIILFCDVERPLRNRIATAVNRAVIRYLGPMTASRNVETEDVGAVNALLERVHPALAAARRFKDRNRTAYYVIKYAVIATVLLLIVGVP